METGALQSSVIQEGDTQVKIYLDGPVTVHTRTHVKTKIKDQIAAGKKTIRVDLSGCFVIDAAGLGMLVACQREAKKQGAELHLLYPSPELMLLFELTRLDTIFQIRTA